MGSDFTNLNAGCHESVPLEAQFAPRMPPPNEDARRREGDASSASSWRRRVSARSSCVSSRAWSNLP